MISVYYYASDERKIWGHIAVALAIMYATLNAAVYFLQMTVVVPFMLNGQAEEVAFITLKMGTFIYSLDVLGYSLMSLATLFAAPVFVGGRLERWIRWSMVAPPRHSHTRNSSLSTPDPFSFDKGLQNPN